MGADRNQKWVFFRKRWDLSHFAGAIKILMRKMRGSLYFLTTFTLTVDQFVFYSVAKKPCRAMAPKGFGAAAKAVAKGRGRGGGGRGAGRKPSAVNSAGADSAAAPKRTQQSLGALLGERFAKKQRTVDNLNAGGFFQQYGRERTVNAREHTGQSFRLLPARL